jgi:hypothetical protein
MVNAHRRIFPPRALARNENDIGVKQKTRRTGHSQMAVMDRIESSTEENNTFHYFLFLCGFSRYKTKVFPIIFISSQLSLLQIALA